MLGQSAAEVTTLDPQHNVLLRMVDWVENGNAPETLTGIKYVNVSYCLRPYVCYRIPPNEIRIIQARE